MSTDSTPRFTLAEGDKIHRDLRYEIEGVLNSYSSTTSTAEDAALAQYIAANLIADGWVTEGPERGEQ